MAASRPQKNQNNADQAQLNTEKEWFGDTHVTPAEKTGRVLGVFDSVASRYDLMNDAMSAGVHRLWKNRLLRMIRPRKGQHILDLAGGTGDIAFRFHDQTQGQSPITVCDINASMLSVGRDRAIESGRLQNIEWVVGNAESLPFPDASFDIVTIAFGLRNVTHIDTALKDIARVLKPGGRFFCLEFSHIDNKPLAEAYRLYSDHVIPRLGQMLAGDADSYRYLVESIRRFPARKALEERMLQAGFDHASSTVMSAGIVAVHEGRVY